MTKALDAAIRAACDTDPMYPTPCTYPDCYCNIWPKGTLAALRAALHTEPPEDIIEDAIEDASEYVSSTWRGSKAWDTKEYAIAQVAAHAAYHTLRARILGEDI